MADPPLRSAGSTSPALDITASDPCALAATMVPILAEGRTPGPDDVEVGDLGPYKCAIEVKPEDGVIEAEARGSVEYTMVPAGDVGGATVEGFPAVRSELGIFCRVVF